jgi:hypothetical protein
LEPDLSARTKDVIRFLNLLWRALAAWLEFGLDCALAFAPAADDVDSCAAMLRLNRVKMSSLLK